jgi:hypothetical protein
VSRSAAAVLLWAATAGAADPAYTVKRATAAPPAEVAAGVRDLLAGECDAVADPIGATVAEVWFRKEIPTTANADQLQNGVTYREVPETTVLAAVRFPKAFTDYRKQEIPAGVYTLRLAFQPDTGDHTGTAPHAEFALLVPAAADTSADTSEVKSLVKQSFAATGGEHPGVMLLYPHAGKADGPGVTNRGGGVWTLDVRRPAVGEAGRSTLGVSLTVAGHSKSR